MKNTRLVFASAFVAIGGATVIAWAQAGSPARARADLFLAGTSTPAGYVEITESGSGYLSQQINLSGNVGGLAAGVPYGLHLWKGTCAAPTAHVGSLGQQHPSHVGDLPNIRMSPTGGFSLTKVTDRFTLSNQTGQKLFAIAGGPIVVIVDSGEDTGTGGGVPFACGTLSCTGGTCSP